MSEGRTCGSLRTGRARRGRREANAWEGGALTVWNSRIFYDKRMSQEVMVDSLGDEFKGYVFRITGGNDVRGLIPRPSPVLTNALPSPSPPSPFPPPRHCLASPSLRRRFAVHRSKVSP